MSVIEVTDPRDNIAATVSEMWVSLNNQRQRWLQRVTDTRRYVTSPTTAFTEVGSSLPWKNKTVIPVLTQLADNLQSYYMAALMPTDDWFRFEGRSTQDQEKANLIEEYMSTKLKMSSFRVELEKMIRDWVIYGNTFAGISYVEETTKSLTTGEDIINYRGPKLKRISPIECVIDQQAETFDESVFICRKMVPLASILEHNDVDTSPPYLEEGLERVKAIRGTSTDRDFVQQFIDTGIRIDGFTEFDSYLQSQYVELLEFWGDVYDHSTGEIMKNRVITVADRSFVLRNDENPAWNGKKPFVHVGWRTLPDNLYGQGPLDHLVGMQYRIDHLENLKADAFDQVIHPMIKVIGDTVEDFEFGPGERIYTGSDGDVEFMPPDTSVLTADNQIAIYRQFMEFAAGSPRESAGFRTPGEKTAFEVNVLQQGADRMFQDKLNHFEELGIQKILNLFFELMMRNFDLTDVARTFNEDTSALKIMEFTKEQVVADGVFRPMGAKHFAARNKRIQEMQNLQQIASDPKISPHFSGLNAAKMFEEELGFEKWNVVEENIGIREQIVSQVFAQQMMQAMGQQAPQEGEVVEG